MTDSILKLNRNVNQSKVEKIKQNKELAVIFASDNPFKKEGHPISEDLYCLLSFDEVRSWLNNEFKILVKIKSYTQHNELFYYVFIFDRGVYYHEV